MPHWFIKCLLQHAVSRLPCRQFWNGQFQRLSGSLKLKDSRFSTKLQETSRILDLFKTRGGETAGSTVLELGTGWFPITPLALYLSGVKRVTAFDIDPLLSPARNAETVARFRDFNQRGMLRELLPTLDSKRLEHLLAQADSASRMTPSKWLAGFGIEVNVRDAQQTGLGTGSVDIIFSSGVINYIPISVLRGLFGEFRRIAQPRAVMLHRMNLADQYSYFDHKLTPWNYLRYSQRAWRWFDSPMIMQNRLRACDYAPLLREAGWNPVEESVQRGDPAQLRSVPLHEDFKHYTEDELLVLHLWSTSTIQK